MLPLSRTDTNEAKESARCQAARLYGARYRPVASEQASGTLGAKTAGSVTAERPFPSLWQSPRRQFKLRNSGQTTAIHAAADAGAEAWGSTPGALLCDRLTAPLRVRRRAASRASSIGRISACTPDTRREAGLHDCNPRGEKGSRKAPGLDRAPQISLAG